MQIKTKFHDEVTAQEDQLWTFSKGLPGFEAEKKFILLPIEGNEVFQVLQSVKTASIAFIVTNPFVLIEDYSFKIDEPTIDQLQIKDQSEVFILNVLSLKNPFETSLINLQAPLIFQTKTKQAKQMILNDTNYSMRHPINPKMKGEV